MAELFYPLGLGLTVLAVVVSFFGLRNKEFPGSKGALAGGIAIFAVLVFATMATGVRNAEEEQDHRENEEAEEAAQETELENEAAQAEEVGQAGGGAAGKQLEEDAPPGTGARAAPRAARAAARLSSARPRTAHWPTSPIRSRPRPAASRSSSRTPPRSATTSTSRATARIWRRAMSSPTARPPRPAPTSSPGTTPSTARSPATARAAWRAPSRWSSPGQPTWMTAEVPFLHLCRNPSCSTEVLLAAAL